MSRDATPPEDRFLPVVSRALVPWLYLIATTLTSPAALTGQSVERVELAPGVHLLRTPFDGYVFGNSVAIVSDDGVVVFDSNTRPSTARSVLAEIRRITPKPVRTVINSHWHPDHWTGNEVYAQAFPGLRVVATATTRDIMKRVAPAWPAVFAARLNRQRAALDTDGTALTADARREAETEIARFAEFSAEMSRVKCVLPNTVYGDSLTLFEGGREIRLVSLSGDAEASTVVYLPKERVLLTGDLLVHPIQWDPNSYRIAPWLASLRAIRALDPAVVVPGHGPAFRDTEYLDLVIELLDSIVSQVHAALERGAVTVADVQHEVKLDAMAPRFTSGDAMLEEDFKATAESLVRKAYLESRDGMESRR